MTGQVNAVGWILMPNFRLFLMNRKKYLYSLDFQIQPVMLLMTILVERRAFLANVFVYADCVPVKDTISPVLLGIAPALRILTMRVHLVISYSIAMRRLRPE